jgi:3-dehydroquinate synthase
MSECFSITAATGSYSVEISEDILTSKLDSTKDQLIICDEMFAPTLRDNESRVIGIVANEAAKSIDRMSSIIENMRQMGVNRNTEIVAIGGGVIQDIATFVASVYMRGLKWAYFPTTLLGMVDSCIGGKSSINVGKYKNLIGNFYPPHNVLVDIRYVETLSVEQRVSGLCEAIKICFAGRSDSFERYLELSPSATASTDVLQKVIYLGLSTKRWFIETDEHDQKERQLLNFGHTFGHAMESASKFSLPHGIAVGLGMLTAIECAKSLGLGADMPQRVSSLRHGVIKLLTEVPELPTWLNDISVDELKDAFFSDKKHTEREFIVVVPGADGYLVRQKMDKGDKNWAIILRALGTVFVSAGRLA